ncbi:FtsB family cell division protein [Aquipuribacter sp. MA13-6]|uniref:FtsB family cell division protein n=1 Tax=unclassified Aquipuribacter TaxID=2635084 RepID=UPI003EEEE93F
MGDARRGRDRDDSGPRTRRVVVLLTLAVVCALVLAPPLRLYVEQQQDIAALRAEIDQREYDVAALETEVGLWDDEAYVAAQARERLNFVMPGETGYVVPDPEPADDGTGAPGADVEAVQRPDAPPEGTWYDRVWSSVEAVGTGNLDPVLDEAEEPGAVDEPAVEPTEGDGADG